MTRSSITAERAKRALHVNVNRERQVDGSGSRSDTGKVAKAAKASQRKGGKGKERGEKAERGEHHQIVPVYFQGPAGSQTSQPTAIEEIDSDEERQTRLGMDDTLEVHQTRGPEDSEERGFRDLVAHPVETSIAQRRAPDLVLWSDEPGGSLEPAGGKSVPIGPNSSGEGHARAHAHEFPQLVQLLRASQSC